MKAISELLIVITVLACIAGTLSYLLTLVVDKAEYEVSAPSWVWNVAPILIIGFLLAARNLVKNKSNK